MRILRAWTSARGASSRSRAISRRRPMTLFRSDATPASASKLFRRRTSARRENAFFATRRASFASATASSRLRRADLNNALYVPALARAANSADFSSSTCASAASARTSVCSYSRRQSGGAGKEAAPGNCRIGSTSVSRYAMVTTIAERGSCYQSRKLSITGRTNGYPESSRSRPANQPHAVGEGLCEREIPMQTFLIYSMRYENGPDYMEQFSNRFFRFCRTNACTGQRVRMRGFPFGASASLSWCTQGVRTSLTRRKGSPACELFSEIRRCSFHVSVPAGRVGNFYGTNLSGPAASRVLVPTRRVVNS